MNRRDEERETCAAQGGGGEGNHKEEGLSLSLSLSLSFFSSFSVFRNWPTFATRHARGSAGRIDPFTKQLSFPSFPPNRPQDTPLPFRPFYPHPSHPPPSPPGPIGTHLHIDCESLFYLRGRGVEIVEQDVRRRENLYPRMRGIPVKTRPADGRHP